MVGIRMKGGRFEGWDFARCGWPEGSSSCSSTSTSK
jgi:hypothetical protein